eukprot:7043161-Heterocapsa_arctica.AAC.1
MENLDIHHIRGPQTNWSSIGANWSSIGACVEGIAAVEHRFIHFRSGAVEQQFDMHWSNISGGVGQWSF